MDGHLPEPESSGSLVPPPRVPPTAVATSAPPPPPPASSRSTRLGRRGIAGLVDAALDSLDTLGDRIAGAVGLR